MSDDRMLTRAEAERRVQRTKRTILRWQERGLIRFYAGRVSERRLLDVDREMRQRKGGRPPTPRQEP